MDNDNNQEILKYCICNKDNNISQANICLYANHECSCEFSDDLNKCKSNNCICICKMNFKYFRCKKCLTLR